MGDTDSSAIPTTSDPPERRIGAIDIGSKSIRQIVADVSADGTIRIVDEMKAAPRLGAGLAATGVLDETHVDQAVAAIVRMAALARQLGGRHECRARCGQRQCLLSARAS